MVELIMSEEEARVLREILLCDLSDLRMEIADTDRKVFRDTLKRKEVCIRNWIEELEDVN